MDGRAFSSERVSQETEPRAARRYDRTVPRPPVRGQFHCFRVGDNSAMNDYKDSAPLEPLSDKVDPVVPAVFDVGPEH